MDVSNLITDTKTKLSQAVSRFDDNLKSLRTGRANAHMLDGVMVEAYGASMPLNQSASINVVEAQLIQITPYDPNNLTAIATAIRNDSNLGLNPADDGRVVRVPIPPLTEERRLELAKQVSAKQEEAMVGLRGIRHEAISVIDHNKKDKTIGEDEAKRLTNQVEDIVSRAHGEIETIAKDKEAEITKI
jgi:ribosome recycling factor